MAKKNYKLNEKAFRDISKEPGVRADLLARAKRIAETAGGEEMGYMVTELVLEDPRGAASVMATGKAHFHNRKHHSLLRALDAGRG